LNGFQLGQVRYFFGSLTNPVEQSIPWILRSEKILRFSSFKNTVRAACGSAVEVLRDKNGFCKTILSLKLPLGMRIK
jgi:hypothetical protein